MNENREISDESQHIFHFVPHFNSKITGPNLTKFSHSVEAAFELLIRSLKYRYPILFRNDRAISAGGS